MIRKICIIGLTCFIGLFLFANISQAQAVARITGPYLWMVAPCEPNQGGQNSTNIDSLDVNSDGDVTEEDIAKKGAKEGDVVGDYEWTYGNLPANGDINAVLVSIGMTNVADFNDVSSYALLVLKTKNAENNVTMGVNSDDSIKVWVNGEVVHTNAVNRGRGGADAFQDQFNIDLKKGNNLLMIKVSERGGGWGMYVGVDADYEIEDLDAVLPVQPAGKLTTQWAQVKNSR